MKTTILCDFDGTITAEDSCQAMLDKFTDGIRWREIEKEWVSKKIGTDECIKRQFELVKASEEEIRKHFSKAKIDPHFKKFLQFCRKKGFKIVIVSDGFDLFIKQTLEANGLPRLSFISNRLWFDNGKMRSKFLNQNRECGLCGNCKKIVFEELKKRGSKIYYIGNGTSDRCVARYADKVFAKGTLIKHCREDKIPFTEFKDFADVIEQLAGDAKRAKSDLEAVLSHYNLGSIKSYKIFKLGEENDNYKVSTRRGVFVARFYKKTRTKEALGGASDVAVRNEIEFELSVIAFLKKHRLPVAAPIPTKGGKTLTRHGSLYCSVFEFLPGKFISRERLTQKQLTEMIQAQARIQRVLKNFRPSGRKERWDLFWFGFDDMVSKADYPKLAAAAPNAKESIATCIKETAALKNRLRGLENKVNCGIIHNDLFDWNVKFRGNKLTAILDFDECCYGALVSDLALTLNDTTIVGKRFDVKKFEAMMRTYLQKITLTREELQLIPYLMRHRTLYNLHYVMHYAFLRPENRAAYVEKMQRMLQKLRFTQKMTPRIQAILTKFY